MTGADGGSDDPAEGAPDAPDDHGDAAADSDGAPTDGSTAGDADEPPAPASDADADEKGDEDADGRSEADDSAQAEVENDGRADTDEDADVPDATGVVEYHYAGDDEDDAADGPSTPSHVDETVTGEGVWSDGEFQPVDEDDTADPRPVEEVQTETAASDGGTVTGAETGAASPTPTPNPSPVGGGGMIDGPEYDEEMPLADHIEEMVQRLGVVIVVMAVVSVATLPFSDELINFIWYSILGSAGAELSQPRVYKPLSLVLARLKTATLGGFVVALPLFVYQTYLFMRPGLYPRERRYYLAAVPTSLVLAAVGVTFAFLLVLPGIFIYFLYYTEPAASIAFGLSDTYGLMLMLMGFFALIFQIPLFIMLAIMMGLTDRQWLIDRRLYFWGGFLGIAFLFSPDPTGLAPIIVAATMVVLFEGTLLLLRWTRHGQRGDRTA